MTSQQKRLLLVGALLLVHAQHASADTDVTVATAVITSPPFTFSFSPIANATELLSITEGTFSGGEGGTASVTVDYSNATTQTLFSANESGIYSINLATVLANLTFPQGTIDGLTFTNPAGSSTISLPQGTVIDFAQVAPMPEPGSLPVLGAALAGLAVMRRRKPAG